MLLAGINWDMVGSSVVGARIDKVSFGLQLDEAALMANK